MKPIQIKILRYLSKSKEDAIVNFESGLNVLCGASDTGKSYIAETIDYMLGGSDPPRDIPQAVSYYSIELTLYIPDEGYYLLKRGYNSGDFLLFSSDENGIKKEKIYTLSQKFKPGKTDSVSGWLLNHIDSLHKKLKRNQKGDKKNLSFRDFARLIIIQETEINKRESPFLSGQIILKTGEKSAIKYILTGVDDSEEYLVEENVNSIASKPKVELIDEWIADINGEIDQYSNKFDYTTKSIERINQGISNIEEKLETEKSNIEAIKGTINQNLNYRRDLVNDIELNKDRQDEILELLSRFNLLSDHYSTDLQRLEAIIESGTLIVYEGSSMCPLCGATEEHQHSDSDCDANFDEIVEAAKQEINKIHVLAEDLNSTIEILKQEEKELQVKIESSTQKLSSIKNRIDGILLTQLNTKQDLFANFVNERQELIYLKKLLDRKSNLELQKEKFSPQTVEEEKRDEATRLVSDSIFNNFSEMLEGVLSEWHYPNSERIHFDKSEFDFVINGVPRGSRGKGFRSITHAAISCTLMKYCIVNDLPHPRFLILDSPLLAYYEPEGDDDSLVGTDLKEKFYSYLSNQFKEEQVIVIENEHPQSELENVNTIDFTKNENQGRYGLFPV